MAKKETKTAAPYEPKGKELEVLTATKARMAARPKFPAFEARTKPDGVVQIETKHPDGAVGLALQLNALGLTSTHEFQAVLKGVFNFTTVGGKADPANATEAMQLVVGMAPTNTTEALLATQMAAIHLATMEAARRMHTTPNSIEAASCNAKILNNLARTFALQAETMKKLKSKGEQKVVVEHNTTTSTRRRMVRSKNRLPSLIRQRGEGLTQKRSINLMNGVFPNAKQCSATSKRTGCRCRAPAVKGWNVCRFHGANGGAPAGATNGRYRHGGRTLEAQAERRWLRELLTEARELCSVLAA